MDSISWETVGAIAAAVAVLVALPPMFTAVRDISDGSRKARQQILDTLPNPATKTLGLVYDVEEERDYIMQNGLDASTLEGRLEANSAAIYKAMRKLVAENKVQIFILKGVIDGSHPNVPAGSPFKMPIFFKGGMNPSLRATPEEAQHIIAALGPRRRPK